MLIRLLGSCAALSTVALLGGCAEPTGSAEVTGSGSENCIAAIQREARTDSLLGSNTSVSASGVTTVMATTAGAQGWTCTARPDGTVQSVERRNEGTR